MDGEADEKRMCLRYAGACRVCGVELPARVEAIYERTTKTVRCVSHDVLPAVEPAVVKVVGPAIVEVVVPAVAEVVGSGTAGASARREFERRTAKREERIRTKHPKLGGLVLAVSDEQQSTTFTTRCVQALWPKKLYPKLQVEGPFTADTVAEIHRKLAHALRAA